MSKYNEVILTVEGETGDAIRDRFRDVMALQQTIRDLSVRHGHEMRDAWAALVEAYPELNPRRRNLLFNHETGEVRDAGPTSQTYTFDASATVAP